jgi:hypothetical protein
VDGTLDMAVTTTPSAPKPTTSKIAHPPTTFSLLGELKRGTRERTPQAFVTSSTNARASTPNSSRATSSVAAPAPIAKAIKVLASRCNDLFPPLPGAEPRHLPQPACRSGGLQRSLCLLRRLWGCALQRPAAVTAEARLLPILFATHAAEQHTSPSRLLLSLSSAPINTSFIPNIPRACNSG